MLLPSLLGLKQKFQLKCETWQNDSQLFHFSSLLFENISRNIIKFFEQKRIRNAIIFFYLIWLQTKLQAIKLLIAHNRIIVQLSSLEWIRVGFETQFCFWFELLWASRKIKTQNIKLIKVLNWSSSTWAPTHEQESRRGISSKLRENRGNIKCNEGR